jgi:hypothetical protein
LRTAAALASAASARGFAAFSADLGHMFTVFAYGLTAFACCFATLFVASATATAAAAAATSL